MLRVKLYGSYIVLSWGVRCLWMYWNTYRTICSIDKRTTYIHTLCNLMAKHHPPGYFSQNRVKNPMCAMVKSRYIGDGHPTFNRNPYNGYINPYYWVDDHPLLYGNNGSLDPGTCDSGETLSEWFQNASVATTTSRGKRCQKDVTRLPYSCQLFKELPSKAFRNHHH